MLKILKFEVSNSCKIFVFGSLLFVATFALPRSAGAQCNNWDASGRLEIQQQGQANPFELTLQQKGRVLTGKAQATFTDHSGFHTQIDRVTALVDGTIDGNSLSIQLYWSNSLLLGQNKVGVYNATIRPSGLLDGEAYEKSSPNVRYLWHSKGSLGCADVPVTPKPYKSTGKPKPKSTGKAKGQPEPKDQVEPKGQAEVKMTVPGIVATQVIYPQPLNPMGFVILAWDAGPDHPYAEVWYKVNNGDDIFLVEQGKGSRQMPVERGKYYTYILTDAGETLATVVVAG